MWDSITKEQVKEFIMSLNLLEDKYSEKEKLNILYSIANHPEKYYTTTNIKKKDGTKREILIPKPILKKIQRNILNNVLYGLSISKYAKGYQKGITIKENAIPHQNKKIVLKLDLKDFFSNITFEHVYKALPNYIFPPPVKVLLIKLCTYYDYLPQGAPTSPYLSNLALKSFDEYIGTYCDARNISYTRYSDDLTFSGDFDPKKLTNKVRAFLEELGFNLNEKKTKVLRKNHRQEITGIVVNEKINIPKYYLKRIRQEIYYIKKYGLDSHCKKLGLEKEQYLLNIKGRINYSLSILGESKELKEYQNILTEIK